MSDLNISQKDADFLNKLQPGDLLLMRADNDLVSKIIRWWTGSKRTHGSTYSGSGNLVEAIWCGVREAHWLKTPYPAKYNVIALRKKGITKEQVDACLNYQRSKIGLNYDFIQVFGLAFVWFFKWFGLDMRKYRVFFDIKNAYYCMELAIEGFNAAGVALIDTKKVNEDQVTPQDVIDYGLDLEVVAEYIA